MQVDGALVDGRERARGLDRPSTSPESRRRSRSVRATRTAATPRRRVVVGAARTKPVAPLAQLAGGGELVERRATVGPRNGSSCSESGASCAAHSRCSAYISALGIEDRRLDRPPQEIVGMAAEELIQGILARDVDRQAAARRPARPHIWRSCHGPGKRDADRGVEPADVDPELQRVGRDDRRAAPRRSAAAGCRVAAPGCSRRGRG